MQLVQCFTDLKQRNKDVIMLLGNYAVIHSPGKQVDSPAQKKPEYLWQSADRVHGTGTTGTGLNACQGSPLQHCQNFSEYKKKNQKETVIQKKRQKGRKKEKAVMVWGHSSAVKYLVCIRTGVQISINLCTCLEDVVAHHGVRGIGKPIHLIRSSSLIDTQVVNR